MSSFPRAGLEFYYPLTSNPPLVAQLRKGRQSTVWLNGAHAKEVQGHSQTRISTTIYSEASNYYLDIPAPILCGVVERIVTLQLFKEGLNFLRGICMHSIRRVPGGPQMWWESKEQAKSRRGWCVMTAVSPPLISVDALFTRPVSDDALS